MQFIEPPGGKPWALLALCGASLLLNVVLLATSGSGEAPAPATANVNALAPTPDVNVAAAQVDPEIEALAELEYVPEEPVAPTIPDGTTVVTGTVTHSLARTFQNIDPERADVVSAVYARLFFWDLDQRRDLQRGDRVAVAYDWDGELPTIHAAVYDSAKLGELDAYRFKAAGDDYDSWWRADGTEAAFRLEQGPLNQYEQVTSLLKDRPTHKGMDFKTPVGTPVVSPKSGTVTRTDWNWKYNGNCVEVRYTDGVTARFLHLSDTIVESGQTVRAGQRLGLSGNTGRSTAPHLHYEIDRSGKTLDPVDYHGVRRRTLSDSDRTAFDKVVATWSPVLDGGES